MGLNVDRIRTVADGLDHPEAVCWSPVHSCLYAGGEDGQLYRLTLDGDVDVVAQISNGSLTGLAVDRAGDVFACDVGNHRVHRISPDGAVSQHGPRIAFPNYPVFGPDGALFVSDSGSWSAPTGAIVRIAPDGSAHVLETRPLSFANGLVLNDDVLLVIESASSCISVVPITGGPPHTLVRLERAVPDGLAFDVEGGLWISCFQPNRVYRLDRQGLLETILDDWSGAFLLTPTNVAFVGPTLATLAIASHGGRAVSAFDPGVRGRPLEYPRVG